MFHSFFFNSQAESSYLSFFSLSFTFTQWSAGDSKVHNSASSLFLVAYYKVRSSGQDYYNYHYYSLEFSHQRKLMVFYRRLSDSKSPQVFRTILSILAIFNNAVVWMVSTWPPTSKSSRPFNNPLVTVPKAPITIGTIVPQFLQFSCKVEVLISLFTFFQFYSAVRRDSKVDNFADFLFLLIIIRSGLLAEVRWSVCISKSHRSLCVSFSRTDAWLCIYHLLVWSNLNFLHTSQWITLPTQSCLALLSFCVNLLHSFIMWLMVSSLSPHSLHLPSCCV